MTPVLIPIVNGRELTRACIKSVLAQDVSVQVFILDNGSTDGSAEMLRAWPDSRVQYIQARKPSVAASWNSGLRFLFAQVDAALVLNNDTLLRPDTVRLLLAENAPFVTCVGNSDPHCIDAPWNPPTAKPRPHPDFSCFMIRKDCYEKVGPFDEAFLGAYCEDSDYHIRMHHAKIHTYCIDLPFYHLGSGAIKQLSEDGSTLIRTNADKNRALFKEKYGCEVGSPAYYGLFNGKAPEEEVVTIIENLPVTVRIPDKWPWEKVNIVMVTNGKRWKLFSQAISTLYATAPQETFSLTIVSDGVTELQGCFGEADHIRLHWEIAGAIKNQWGALPDNISIQGVFPPCHVIGRLKNLGAYWSEKQFGRGEWLCFLDDDIAFFPGWLERMTKVLESSNLVRILGGVKHPFHGVQIEVRENGFGWQATDAVAGYCHFMRWSTWDKFGPYDAHAKGTGQSEDFALCRKVVDAGEKVGYIHPPVMAHCGITDSQGKPILGGDQIERVPGILYE